VLPVVEKYSSYDGNVTPLNSLFIVSSDQITLKFICSSVAILLPVISIEPALVPKTLAVSVLNVWTFLPLYKFAPSHGNMVYVRSELFPPNCELSTN